MQKLTEAPILAHPDFTQQFILDTDGSNFAIGGILYHRLLRWLMHFKNPEGQTIRWLEIFASYT